MSTVNCVNSVTIVSDGDGDDTFICDGVFYQFHGSPEKRSFHGQADENYGGIHIVILSNQ